ncbi:hypothetical protein [Roseovarius pacificus]|uniref:hypothetical protein n=1 Tax=Roseovarius pacificus TaxID=337701 RepID=UPI002A18AB5D|nr:hypothetical protein [Roseovarius pacificus]
MSQTKASLPAFQDRDNPERGSEILLPLALISAGGGRSGVMAAIQQGSRAAYLFSTVFRNQSSVAFQASSSVASACRQGDLRTLMRSVAAFCDETRKIYDLIDTAHPFATSGVAR